MTDSKIETARISEEVREQIEVYRASIATLTESLAASNAEAELFRRKYSELQLRMEALGLDSANKDRAKLEQRLLHAVSDLQMAQKEKDAYREHVLRLGEALLHFLKTSAGGDPNARMEVEAQLRRTNELISESGGAGKAGEGTASSLMDGSVISVKEEWSLVVGDLGEKQGLKLGMPMRVVRDDRVIATLRVVDVRQKICGAIVQKMESEKEKIRVGDRLQVDARREVTLK